MSTWEGQAFMQGAVTLATYSTLGDGLPGLDRGLESAPEVLQGLENGPGRGLADVALGGVLDHPGQALQLVQVRGSAPALADPAQDGGHTGRAHAAGETLAAGLLGRLLHVGPAHVHHVDRVIPQDKAVPAHEGLELGPGKGLTQGPRQFFLIRSRGPAAPTGVR